MNNIVKYKKKYKNSISFAGCDMVDIVICLSEHIAKNGMHVVIIDESEESVITDGNFKKFNSNIAVYKAADFDDNTENADCLLVYSAFNTGRYFECCENIIIGTTMRHQVFTRVNEFIGKFDKPFNILYRDIVEHTPYSIYQAESMLHKYEDRILARFALKLNANDYSISLAFGYGDYPPTRFFSSEYKNIILQLENLVFNRKPEKNSNDDERLAKLIKVLVENGESECAQAVVSNEEKKESLFVKYDI